jgi:hypothetical protein
VGSEKNETLTFFFLFLQLSQRFFVATPTMMNHQYTAISSTLEGAAILVLYIFKLRDM